MDEQGTVTLDFTGSEAVDAAIAAHARGWAPVPIRAGEKRPEDTDWRSMRFSSRGEIAPAFWNKNIGIILGAASGNLVDVDLDNEFARRLATSLLPKTPLKHGREAAPSSHWWYKSSHEVSTSQYKDPTDKEMLVELRATGGQTIIPPSVHPSGEVLKWNNAEAYPAEVNRGRLVKHVRVLAAAALLAKHWPASGGRHDASMALAGGLLRAGWSPDNTASFVVAVGWAVDPKVDRKDRVDAVKSTVKRLEKDDKARGWPALAADIGEKVVEKAREWLDLEVEEDDVEGEGKLHRSAIHNLLDKPIPPPDWLLEDTLYARRIHWMAGEPGDGKTLLMLALAAGLAREGKTIMWIDEESGEVQTAERLQAIGLQKEVGEQRFFYYEMPGITIRPQDLDDLFREASEVEPDLIVFDSAADMLGQAGLDEDSNTEVTRWIKTVCDPLKHIYGAATVVIDHVVKSKDNRSGWARGAGAKKSKSDVLLMTSKDRDFNRDTVGALSLRVAKDRDGRMPQSFGYKIGGDGQGNLLLNRAELQQAAGDSTADPLERELLDFLRLNAVGEEHALSTNEVVQHVSGKTDRKKDALQALVDRVDSGVSCQQRGRGRYYWYDASVLLDFSLERD